MATNNATPPPTPSSIANFMDDDDDDDVTVLLCTETVVSLYTNTVAVRDQIQMIAKLNIYSINLLGSTTMTTF